MKKTPHTRSGFTLTEVLIACAISGLVLSLAIMVYFNAMRTWRGFALRASTEHTLTMAINTMVYGVGGTNRGVRAAEATSATVTSNANGWKLDYKTGYPQVNNSFEWSRASGEIVYKPGNRVIGTDIAASTVSKSGPAVTIFIRVERSRQGLTAAREASTVIYLRN